MVDSENNNKMKEPQERNEIKNEFKIYKGKDKKDKK